MIDKSFLHSLFSTYYGLGERKKQDRQVCLGCGLSRVLGKRGTNKLYCMKCRKKRRNIQCITI